MCYIAGEWSYRRSTVKGVAALDPIYLKLIQSTNLYKVTGLNLSAALEWTKYQIEKY